MAFKSLGRTSISIPPVIFGTSCLGNLYETLSDTTKHQIMREWFKHQQPPVILDSAGKYGAGLALEVIGSGLKTMNIRSEDVIISNKLGWFRVPLRTPEPLFEPGIWKNLQHDAIQKISYRGIKECWEQGCELVGMDYQPQILSVHDPDEYLAQAGDEKDKAKRFQDILDAYRALDEIKKQGYAKAIGVGAKNWQVIREISDNIELDWVMLALSFTIYTHPPQILQFIDKLAEHKIGIINSAVFNAGFLTGGEYFNYRKLNPMAETDQKYYQWRERFFSLCRKFDVSPADACVQFGFSHPGVVSIALNTSKPERIKQNVASVMAAIPNGFWTALKNEAIISKDYPYLG